MESILDLTIPDMGQTGEIELLEWKIQAGMEFNEGDEICDLLTDKAAFTLDAPGKGTLLECFVSNGDKVVSGQVVGKVKINSTRD